MEMPPESSDDSSDDLLGPKLREALDRLYGSADEDFVHELEQQTQEIEQDVKPTQLVEDTASPGQFPAEDSGEQELEFFLESHCEHCLSTEGVGEDAAAEGKAAWVGGDCRSRSDYEAFYSSTVSNLSSFIALLLTDESLAEIEEVSGDLVAAIAALLQSLAKTVPLCALQDFAAKLQALHDDLSTVVSLVIALGPLVAMDPNAVINISERVPAELWLLYVKWFVVVGKLTGQFPWFGDAEGYSFWLALEAECPSTEEKTSVLNQLEAAVQRSEEQEGDAEDDEDNSSDSVAHEMELNAGFDAHSAAGTDSDSDANDSTESVETGSSWVDEGVEEENAFYDQTSFPFTLTQLGSYLNFASGPSTTPFRLDDIPRLSRQARRWTVLLSGSRHVQLDPEQTSQVERPEFQIATCLYYIEHLEALYDLNLDWGDAFVSTWADEAAHCTTLVAVGSVFNRMYESLRRIVKLPHRSAADFRLALARVDPLTGPVDFVSVQRSVIDLTVEEVVDSLRAARSMSDDVLAQIHDLTVSIVSSRSDSELQWTASPKSTAFQTLLSRLDRTVRAIYGFYLFPVQLVAVICATYCTSEAVKSPDAAKVASILQMETGEGKSVTFAVIAAFHALQGKSVDVATSSSQLARDGERSAARLFDALGLTHGISCHRELAKNGDSVACYLAQIVYGTISELAGDYLRDVIFGQGGRGSHSFGVLLLDEVDAALVDGAANLTMLSMDVPGMDRLYFLYGAVLQKVKRTMELEGDRSVMPHYTDAEFRAMLGLPALATSEADEGDASGELQTETTESIIPKCLLVACDKKLPVYIEHAWATQTWLRKGRQYDVVNKKIVVIDSKTSGEYQASSVYSEGLHQFLQIQHGSALTPESLNSVYISNGALAQRYDAVVGITGTIGPTRDQQAMRKALRGSVASFAVLPRSKLRPYTQFPPLVLSDSMAWRECWLQETERCVGQEHRPVLLIFADKATACREAEYIESRLELTVKRYIINDRSFQTFSAATDLLEPGDVVVSTNFGGRGTDYKLTRSATANGGLHTVLTFYAASIRVIAQAFGRSARAGSPGSGVLIAFDGTLGSDDLFARRLEQEAASQQQYRESLAEQMKTNLPLNDSCDALFQRFAKLHTALRKRLTEARNAHNKLHFQRAIRDRYGLFIEELRHDIAMRIEQDEETCSSRSWIQQYAEQQYNAWGKAVNSDLKAGDELITNERCLLVYARDMPDDDGDHALAVVERALKSDPTFAGPAGRMLLLKLTLKKKRFNPRKEGDYERVKQLLEQARDAFTAEIEFVGAQHELLVQGLTGSDLDHQLSETMNVLFIMRDCVAQGLAEWEASHEKRGQEDDDKFYVVAKFEELPSDVGEAAQQVYRDQLRPNGHVGLLQLEVKREWTWDWNAFGCVLLGLAQTVGGALAMAFSAGVYGAGLIAEGISDIVSGIVAVAKGDGSFSWREYFTSKAISLALSLVCSGVCKVGKAIWKAGKALVQRGLSVSKTMWKSGLRAVRMAAKRGFKVLKATTKRGVTLMRRPALVLNRVVFQAGLVKCGNQLGKHVVKQVLLSGAKMGVDQGIREAFNALEAKIAELVRLKISRWVDATHGQKMEQIHYMYLFERQGVSPVQVVVHSSKIKLFERQNAGNPMLEDLSRRFANAMATRITDGLEKTENSKLCVVAFCVKALAEGAKWAEVSVQVGKFVEEWLEVVAEAVEDEFQHLSCVDVTAAASALQQWSDAQSDTAAGFTLHPVGERMHWHPSNLTEIEALAASESLQEAVLGSRLLLAEARKKATTADGFEARSGTDGGQWKAWETPRNLFVLDLVNVATAFIRGKLERRTAEFSNRMAAYGLGKLVDKTADAYLRNKAKRLMAKQPQDEDEAAALDRRIEHFMGDNEATAAAGKGVDDIVENSSASMGVIHALARKDDLSVVIHHADGTTTVVNPSGSNAPIHMDESGSGKTRHLVPRVFSEADGSIAFNDSLSHGASDCMYRAYFFLTNGRNASDSEITQYRRQTAEHFNVNRNERLLLYIHRRPKRVWGSRKNRNKLPMETADTPVQENMVDTKLAWSNEVIKGQSQVGSYDEKIGLHQIVAMWDYDTVNPSKGIATVFKLPESKTKTLRDAVKGNTKADGYVRIDQQTPASDGIHLVYEVQIGNRSYATVKMQPKMNIGKRQIRNAFITSHREQRVVTIEVADTPSTQRNEKRAYKRR